MNIIEAYKEAIECGGKITFKGNNCKYIATPIGIYTENGQICSLYYAFLMREDFIVVGGKFGFTKAFNLMQNRKTMILDGSLYRIVGGGLQKSDDRWTRFSKTDLTSELVNSKEWEEYKEDE